METVKNGCQNVFISNPASNQSTQNDAATAKKKERVRDCDGFAAFTMTAALVRPKGEAFPLFTPLAGNSTKIMTNGEIAASNMSLHFLQAGAVCDLREFEQGTILSGLESFEMAQMPVVGR